VSHKSDILKKIKNKTLTVGVIGLGYVGLPLVLRFNKIGFKVIGFDNDNKVIKSLRAGRSYINHISESDIKNLIKKNFEVTSDYNKITETDFIILCLPTPLKKNNEPNLKYIRDTLSSIEPYLKNGHAISLESTTYPGTTEEEILPIAKRKKLKVGENLFVIYSPEREDPGNKKYSLKTIPKVVGGITNNCLKVGEKLYGSAIDNVVPVSSTKVAEMTKLLENIYRSVNIGLVNEMKIVADRMGIDIYEVISAAKTKPFGFNAYYPGPGLGGHCIPIDPFYLSWKAKKYNIETRFIELAGEINHFMPKWVVNKVSGNLKRINKRFKNLKVLVLGIAYKKNIDDTRESPSVEIMDQLRKKGCTVHYSDPYIKTFPKMRDYSFKLSSVSINADNLKKYDMIIIATDHDNFNYKLIKDNSKLIIDTRRVYSKIYDNIVQA
tara:strand:+ start:515 stop:1825 length:1311 start_codon:yes stop_codon:yes gene_type:complete